MHQLSSHESYVFYEIFIQAIKRDSASDLLGQVRWRSIIIPISLYLHFV